MCNHNETNAATQAVSPAAGIELTQQERETAMRWAAEPAVPGMTVFKVWPVQRTGRGDLILAGRCPICGIEHSHGLGGFSTRSPHCSVLLPTLNGRPIPDLYRLKLQDGPAPADLLFALEQPTDDLLQFTALLLKGERPAYSVKQQELRSAESAARRRSKRITREVFLGIIEVMARSGIFDERAAIQLEGIRSNRPQHEVESALYRDLIARFIRATPVRNPRHEGERPDTQRRRLARALYRARKMVARGEAAA